MNTFFFSDFNTCILRGHDFHLIVCCHLQPISIANQKKINSVSNKIDDIFDKKIINSISSVNITNPPPCFHDDFTSNTLSDNEPCAEKKIPLTCPGNFFEVVYSSYPSEIPIFLRKVSILWSTKCQKENNVCLSCDQATKCKTEPSQFKLLVQLDSNSTTVIKKFNPRTGKTCKCTLI